MLLDLITATVGLSFIDDNMMDIVDALGYGGPQLDILTRAKNIGIWLALGVAAYESYMMMLGRRGMDVMKILRIIIIAICISQSTWIAGQLKAPGYAMAAQAKAKMNYQNAALIAKEEQYKEEQDDFIDKMFTHLDSLHTERSAKTLAEASGIEENIGAYMSSFGDQIDTWGKKAAIWVQVNIGNGLNYVIRWLAEVIFQMMYYGILITQKVVLNLMTQFLPLAFALSLAPPFKSAWSQFISKFLSVTLWAPIAYMMVCYVDTILIYALSNDAAAMMKIKDMSWGEIGGLGLNIIGTTVTYATGMFIGAKMISMTTEIAGWLIPGGMSSGMGAATTGAVMGATVGAATSSVSSATSISNHVGGASIGALGGSMHGTISGARHGIGHAAENFKGVGADFKYPSEKNK